MASTIRRRVGVVLGLVAAAAVVVAAYAFRDRLRLPHDDRATVSGAPSAPPQQAAGETTPAVTRGDVSIDPQRQQLIGVRLATVAREPTASVVRTTGVVRYDETRLADVNVKLDGWIRDLRVAYT